MLYKYRILIYLVLLATLLGFVAFLVFASKTEITRERIVFIEIRTQDLAFLGGNTLMAVSSPYAPKFQVLGMEVGKKLFYIIQCESNFDPAAINKTYGKSGGQGLCQFIPKTWADTIKRMGDLLPEECRTAEAVFDGKCNLLACEWLLNADGDIHWKPYSGHCWLKYL